MEFFPRMHELVATRPNVVPIVIHTAGGPNGPSSVYPQPPSPISSNKTSPSGTIERTLPVVQPSAAVTESARKAVEQGKLKPVTKAKAASPVSTPGITAAAATRAAKRSLEQSLMDMQE
jgi:hypothetical protein